MSKLQRTGGTPARDYAGSAVAAAMPFASARVGCVNGQTPTDGRNPFGLRDREIAAAFYGALIKR